MEMLTRLLGIVLAGLLAACDPSVSALTVVVGQPAAAPASGCASGDLINETFDTASGYDLAWTPTGTTPNPDSTGYSFTGGSGQVFYVAADDENETLYSTYTHSSNLAVTYHRVKFRIVQESIASGAYARFIHLTNTGGTYFLRGRVDDTSGQLSLYMEAHGSPTGTLSTNIAVNTDYTWEFMWNDTANTWAWKLNGTQIGSGTMSTTRQWGRTDLGMQAATNTANGINIYYECYAVSTSGWVGD